jgi:TatD DNase family protein
MYIDTHAHVNFKYFKEDSDKVIQNALEEKVWMINVGAEYRTSKRAIEMANKYEKGVYAAVGLHPMHLFSTQAIGEGYNFKTRDEEFNYDAYEKLASFEKVVAIGEIGLDYYRLDPNLDLEEVKRVQRETFYQQLLLAHRLKLPVIIHCRQAHDDLLEVIYQFRRDHKELISSQPWGVMHCFSGDEDLAWKYFNLGLLISFTGLITFSQQWDDLIRKIPSDKFMLETDCPFMTPEPFRGTRNEPIYVKYVAQRMAEIRGKSVEKIEEVTEENAKNLFKIKD